MNQGPDPLAARVVEFLYGLDQSMATSESLTGGLIAAAITSVPGASAVYRGGVVAYTAGTKAKLSGVPKHVLKEHTAVSEQTVAAMAAGIAELTGADWAVAASGVAGPSGQDGQPPGTVWVGVFGPDGTATVLHRFSGDRDSVRTQTVAAALGLLLANLPAGGGALRR